MLSEIVLVAYLTGFEYLLLGPGEGFVPVLSVQVRCGFVQAVPRLDLGGVLWGFHYKCVGSCSLWTAICSCSYKLTGT